MKRYIAFFLLLLFPLQSVFAFTITSHTVPSAGGSFTVYGDGFGTTSGSLYLNGISLPPSNWTDTSISTVLPTTATSGDFGLYLSGGNGASFPLTVYPNSSLPKITDISPSAIHEGSVITLKGQNLGSGPSSGTQICFTRSVCTTTTSLSAILLSWTDTEIRIQVPIWTIPNEGTIDMLLPHPSGDGNVWISSPWYQFSTIYPEVTNISVNDPVTAESTIVTAYGSHLGTFDSTKDKLCFNEVCLNATYIQRYLQSWTDTNFRFIIPVLPNNTVVHVTVYKELYTNQKTNEPVYAKLVLDPITLAAQSDPTIDSISPTSSIIPGQTVLTISGRGFGDVFTKGAQQICFNTSCVPMGTEGEYIQSWSPTEIKLVVPDFVRLFPEVQLSLRLYYPSDGSYHQVKSQELLSVPSLPNIEKYFPTMETGVTYYVEGDHFGSSGGSVFLDGKELPIKSWSDTRIEFVIPSNAHTGVLQVGAASGFTSLPLAVVVQQVKRPTDDPLSHYQWYIDALNVPKAWETSEGSSQVVVAIIDSAVDITQEDLKNNIWTNADEIPNNRRDDDSNGYIDDVYGWDFVTASGSLQPVNSHGTQIATVIAAEKDNMIGIAGLAPKSRIMSLDVSLLENDGSVSVDVDAVQEAILYAVDNGASIINLSFGGISPSPVYQDVLQYAYDHNVVVVAAAGNMNLDLNSTFFTPVCEEGTSDLVLGVAAVDRTFTASTFTNFGSSCIDVSAPGEEIIGGIPMNTPDVDVPYSINEGTSFSAPIVSSAAALLRAVHPTWNVAEIYAAIENNTTALTGFNSAPYGSGAISFANLLAVSKPTTVYTPSTDLGKPDINDTNQRIDLPDVPPIAPPLPGEEEIILPRDDASSSGVPEFTASAPFPDVPASSSYASAIGYLKDLEVIQGYPDGSFQPDRIMNRAEFLKTLFEANGSTVNGTFGNCFPDVHNEWFAKYVCLAKTLGVVQGYGDGFYRPDQAVNKAEALKILSAVNRLKSSSVVIPFVDVVRTSWYAPYVMTALNLNLLEEEGSSTYLHPSDPVKRKVMAELLYRLTYLQRNALERFPLE